MSGSPPDSSDPVSSATTGLLSFYNARTKQLLHTFKAKFTQPLLPAFTVGLPQPGDGSGGWALRHGLSLPLLPGVVWQLPRDHRPAGAQLCALPAEARKCHQQLQHQPQLGHRAAGQQGVFGVTGTAL